MMNKKRIIWASWLVIMVVIVSGVLVLKSRNDSLPPTREGYQLWGTYPVYSVTAPFGAFQLQGDAVFLSGTELSTEEVYIIKYMDGNELKTVTQEATKSVVIVDGTFKLEEYRYVEYKVNPDGSINILKESWRSRGDPLLGGAPIQFKLHIPGLPEPEMNLTSWYIG
jgi:hypothetical protein